MFCIFSSGLPMMIMPLFFSSLTTLITALEQDIPEALDFLDSSVAQIDSLTNALFELSRLGRRELRLEQVDMDTLIQETIQELSPQIETLQAKVIVGSLPPVIADWSSMGLILDNLLIIEHAWI